MKTQSKSTKMLNYGCPGSEKAAAVSFSLCVSGAELCAVLESGEDILREEKLSEISLTVEAETAGTACVSIKVREEKGFTVVKERLYAFNFTIGGASKTEKKQSRQKLNGTKKVFVPQFINRGAVFLRL